ADGQTRELLSEIVHLVGGLGAGEHPEGLRPVLVARAPEALGGPIQRLVPRRAPELPRLPHHRLGQPNVRRHQNVSSLSLTGLRSGRATWNPTAGLGCPGLTARRRSAVSRYP